MLDMYLEDRLKYFQSKRGTSHDEAVNKILGGVLDTVQLEDLANVRISDRVYRFNIDRSFKLYGTKHAHAYDPLRMLLINELCKVVGLPPRYPDLKAPSADGALAEEAKMLGFQGARCTKAAVLPEGLTEELLADAFDGDGGEVAAGLHGTADSLPAGSSTARLHTAVAGPA